MENTNRAVRPHPLRRAVIFECLLCVLPTLICAALLNPIAAYIDGDVLRETEFTVLTTVIDFVSVAAKFSALGTIIYAVFALGRRACALATAIYAVTDALSLGLAAFWQIRLSSTLSGSSGYILLYSLANLVVNLAVVAGVIFIALLLRRRAKDVSLVPSGFFSRANPLNVAGLAAAALVLLLTLISNATETISLVSLYGGPVNLTELLYLVTPYLDALIYFAIGYSMSALSAITLARPADTK